MECILQFSWNYQNLQFLNTIQKPFHIQNYPVVNVHRRHNELKTVTVIWLIPKHLQIMVYFMMPVSQTK